MHSHSHAYCCEHANVKYCGTCKVPYCVDCGKEWGRFTWNTLPAYNGYYSAYTLDQYNATAQDTAHVDGGVTVCNHSGDTHGC